MHELLSILLEALVGLTALVWAIDVAGELLAPVADAAEELFNDPQIAHFVSNVRGDLPAVLRNLAANIDSNNWVDGSDYGT